MTQCAFLSEMFELCACVCVCVCVCTWIFPILPLYFSLGLFSLKDKIRQIKRFLTIVNSCSMWVSISIMQCYLRLVSSGVMVEVKVEHLDTLRPEFIKSSTSYTRLPVWHNSHKLTHRPMQLFGQHSFIQDTHLNKATVSMTLSMPVSLFSCVQKDGSNSLAENYH